MLNLLSIIKHHSLISLKSLISLNHRITIICACDLFLSYSFSRHFHSHVFSKVLMFINGVTNCTIVLKYSHQIKNRYIGIGITMV